MTNVPRLTVAAIGVQLHLNTLLIDMEIAHRLVRQKMVSFILNLHFWKVPEKTLVPLVELFLFVKDETNICLNGGTRDYAWSWCNCVDGYSGSRCEQGTDISML